MGRIHFSYKIMPPGHEENMKKLAIAERVNGCAAMIGFVAALGAYFSTGQIIPGLL